MCSKHMSLGYVAAATEFPTRLLPKLRMTWPFAAVAQFCATAAITANTATCRELVERAAAQGAKVHDSRLYKLYL